MIWKQSSGAFSASNSIWPIVCICIPCPNPSPAFPVMPQQMPDIEVESEQLFPLLHCCISLHNLLSFALPSPTAKIKKPLPLPLACSVYQSAGLSYQGLGSPRKAQFIVSGLEQMGPRARGVVRSCPRRLRAPWGRRGRAAQRGRALLPPSLPPRTR